MGVKGQVELGQGSQWSRILGGKVSWRLAPESGTCRQCSSQLSLAQTSRVGWGPCLLCHHFHYFWRPLECSLKPRPSSPWAVLLPRATLLPCSPSCLLCCLADSSGIQGPKETAVILQAQSPSYSKPRLPSHAETAPSQGLFGDPGGGSLTCRTELTSGIKTGDHPASQTQLHVGTTRNCSNVLMPGPHLKGSVGGSATRGAWASEAQSPPR